jgi:hypothetical protein
LVKASKPLGSKRIKARKSTRIRTVLRNTFRLMFANSDGFMEGIIPPENYF